jgi:hypothetical protein
MRRRCRAILFVAVLAVPATGRAATISVPVQYGTIQAAVDAAGPSDTIALAAGTYSGDGNHDIDFRGKGILLRSVAGAPETIIDARATKADRRRVFHFRAHEDSTSRLEGLTIQGGWAPADGPSGRSWGGGVFCDSGATPLIVDCVIRGNAAATGGAGIGCAHGGGGWVRGCDIVNNESIHTAPEATGGWGGGVGCFSGASLSLERCRVTGNRGNLGGGVSAWSAHIALDHCDIRDNVAPAFVSLVPPSGGNGGGLLLLDAHIELRWCTVAENRAEPLPSTGGRGGGVAAYFAHFDMENCTLHGNASESGGVGNGLGAGVYCSNTSPRFLRCVLSFNHEGEAIYCIDPESQPELTCCNIYGNDLGNWTGAIAGQLGSAGNLQLDPLYCPLPGSTLSLDDRSPCLPINNSCGELMGSTGLGCFTTDVESDPDAAITPSELEFDPPFPNPFNASTLIRFRTNASAAPLPVSVCIYNLNGQRVRVLRDNLLLAGSHEVAWHGRDDRGSDLSSGVYVVVLSCGERLHAQKILLLK